MIISNPPWITASKLGDKNDLDNGVFDPDASFLKAIFKFAGNFTLLFLSFRNASLTRISHDKERSSPALLF